MSKRKIDFAAQVTALNTRRQEDISNKKYYLTVQEIIDVFRSLGIVYYGILYKHIVSNFMNWDDKGYHWENKPIHIDWLKTTITSISFSANKKKPKVVEVLPSPPDVVLLPENCTSKSISITESNGTITIVIK